MDIKFFQGGGPSFSKLYGNTLLELPVNDSLSSIIWSIGEPSLSSDDHPLHLLTQAL